MFGSALKVGQVLECKYPKHGTRNILCNQLGIIEKVGMTSKNGGFAVIQRQDGSYRSLSINKMVSARVK